MAFRQARLHDARSDGTVVVWNVENGQVLIDRQARKSGVLSLCFCGDESTLLAGSADRSAALWHVEHGNVIHDFGEHGDWVCAVGATHDGTLLATGTWSGAPEIRLWHRTSHERLGTLIGHPYGVAGLAFFRDGKTAVSASVDRTVRIWDVAACEERFVIDGEASNLSCLAVSPDERTLAAGTWDGAIRLYRAARPEEVKAVPGWWRVEECP